MNNTNLRVCEFIVSPFLFLPLSSLYAFSTLLSVLSLTNTGMRALSFISRAGPPFPLWVKRVVRVVVRLGELPAGGTAQAQSPAVRLVPRIGCCACPVAASAWWLIPGFAQNPGVS